MEDETFPLFVACVVSLFVYVISAASVALEEEECVAQISEAAQIIRRVLVANHWRNKRQSDNNDEVVRVTRRCLIGWDRERAYKCILQDYLGVHPTFGLDDFKRIF
jgi:hypothetical protein